MLNICKKVADDNNTCDSIAFVAQTALLAVYDGRMLTAKINLFNLVVTKFLT